MILKLVNSFLIKKILTVKLRVVKKLKIIEILYPYLQFK
jgi:hypothetical protein